MSDSTQSRASELIAEVWQRSLPQIRERLALLDAAAAAAQSGTLAEPQRAAAESVAHKFSGSLGMFGFPEGTDLARALEDEYRSESPNPDVLAELTASLRAALFPQNS
jgi:HPt (histidine-containing phosphotransfer) domain-containing protein